jgi:hypothetical protein
MENIFQTAPKCHYHECQRPALSVYPFCDWHKQAGEVLLIGRAMGCPELVITLKWRMLRGLDNWINALSVLSVQDLKIVQQKAEAARRRYDAEWNAARTRAIKNMPKYLQDRQEDAILLQSV